MARKPAIIRASEIGEYVYCARSWWMRRVLGYEPAGHERREQGTVLHQRHGRAVMASGTLIWLSIVLGIAVLGLLWYGN